MATTLGAFTSPRRSSSQFTSTGSTLVDSGVGSSTQSSFESKRPIRARENQFVNKYGKRHHSYDPEKAPYPLSYDKEVIELEAIDNSYSLSVTGSVTMINWAEQEEGLPQKSLDLGCGAGFWIVNAAKEWPNCQFVGFDLVNVQLPLKLLDPSIGNRVKFVHGNFLTTRLPFDEDEFDHVHISGISLGVPENKWGYIFEEVNRVLRPGGAVEVAEEDIFFPTLPRWFTNPLRNRVRRSSSIHFPDGSTKSSTSTPPLSPSSTHDHALLESLFYSVFHSRFINTKPTAVIPIYFTSTFRQVLSVPNIKFPVPSFPPPVPLPVQKSTSSFSAPDPSGSSRSGDDSQPVTRPTSSSFSSSVSLATTNSSSPPLTHPGTSQTSFASSTTPDVRTVPELLQREASSSSSQSGESTPLANASRRTLIDYGLSVDSTPIGFDETEQLIPRDKFAQQLNDPSLTIHLYRAYQGVLACQESMWEELKDRIRNRKESLRALGWEDDEELEGLKQSRQKFERLVERYRSDMHARLGLWHSLSQIGWPLPPRETLSKAELLEEERIHQAILESRRLAAEEEAKASSRIARVLVGYKRLED
ncbi:hypothetical protein NEOLEDRAFT_1153257 [Neolentinus lepideus HHB14362 ss-1]|uniref:Methyltransferase domain-containing protein n=1 Tax=Neolentinus lepideus HHB14362 ss-1 TaxID=1314782 RepID=A0A165W7X6_9AGAM|nr:hypothetical protein NEOLEDRAFT_1153257 [Neolentinus lepideus HHB14362 ss-1]